MSVIANSNRCLHPTYFAEQSYCRHISPLRSLLLDSSSAVATTPSMSTDFAATPHLYPLFLSLAAHQSKIVLDHYMTAPSWWHQKVGTPAGSGFHLVVAIDGQVVVHSATKWRKMHVTGILIVPVFANPLLIFIFWGFSVIPPYGWVWPLLRIAAFLLYYLTKRSYYHDTS